MFIETFMWLSYIDFTKLTWMNILFHMHHNWNILPLFFFSSDFIWLIFPSKKVNRNFCDWHYDIVEHWNIQIWKNILLMLPFGGSQNSTIFTPVMCGKHVNIKKFLVLVLLNFCIQYKDYVKSLYKTYLGLSPHGFESSHHLLIFLCFVDIWFSSLSWLSNVEKHFVHQWCVDTLWLTRSCLFLVLTSHILQTKLPAIFQEFAFYLYHYSYHLFLYT